MSFVALHLPTGFWHRPIGIWGQSYVMHRVISDDYDETLITPLRQVIKKLA